MTISENIFKFMKERNIKQKEFAVRTGISESTISDWKRKGTNPASDKIMILCEVLAVSPYELLSTCDSKYVPTESLTVLRDSEEYEVLKTMRELDTGMRNRIIGYARALCEDNGVNEGRSAAAAVKSQRKKKETVPESGRKKSGTRK